MTDDLIRLFKLQDININKDLSFIHNDEKELKIHLFLNKVQVFCPICGSADCIGHGIRKRNIIHSISNSEPCHIVLYSKRFICKDCGKTFLEHNPFSEKKSQISNKTIVMILDDLRSHTSTFTNVAKKYNVSVQSVINIFEKYVNCSRKNLPEILCIDEIYTKKLTKHKYCCVLLNFETKELVDILPSRHKLDLINYFSKITETEAHYVKYVVIDMWDSYKDVVNMTLFDPIIAVDSFHVIKHLNDAMDKIRLSVMRKFDRGKSTIENAHTYYYMLKKFHYFFKKNYDFIYDGEISVGQKGKWTKDEIRKYLLGIDDDLTAAYRLKQRYQEFNLTAKYDKESEEQLTAFIDEFMKSKFNSFKEFGKLLKHWKVEIKNSFITIDGRRLSNGCMEGANSRLKCIIKNSNGYTNFGRFRNRCIFSLNKNTPIRLYPKNRIK